MKSLAALQMLLLGFPKKDVLTITYDTRIVTTVSMDQGQIVHITSENPKTEFDFRFGTITYESGVTTTLDTRKGSIANVYLNVIQTRLTLGFYTVS